MINWLGIIEFAVLTLAFWIFGRRILIFCGIFLLMMIGFFLLAAPREAGHNGADMILTMGGVFLYFLGLLIVRLVIDRSVSIHLLLAANAETRLVRLKEEISDRVSDISRYGLGKERDGVLRLSALGAFMAAITAFFYVILKQKK